VRVALALVAFLASLLAGGSLGRALRDVQAPARSGISIELIVLEAQGCIYCDVLRRELGSLQRASSAARSVPIRFVDIAQLDDRTPLLEMPVTIVPTAVLLRDGREVDRISGYAGPELLLRLITQHGLSVD